MTEKTSGAKSPITLRRVLPIAAVLLVFALVFVTPVAGEYIVEVSSETQLDEAVTNTAGPTTIVLADGDYTFPKVAMGNKEITFKGATGATPKIDLTYIQINMFNNIGGTDLTFDGVKVEFSDANEGYQGLKDAKKVVYKNCIINGTQFMYSDADFINCVFNTENSYAVYGRSSCTLTFTDCTFYTGGRAIMLYNDGPTKVTAVLTGCTFSDSGAYNSKNKAVVELGDNPNAPAKTSEFTVTIEDCTITDGEFSFEPNGIDGNKWIGNKDSMPSDRILGTVDGVRVTGPYTITFNTNGGTLLNADGTPIDSIDVKYGEIVPAVPEPTKDGVMFDRWEPAIPTTMPNKDMEITAIWKAKESYEFTYSLDASTATIFAGETLSIPIKFENTENVAPSVWYINVAVTGDNVDNLNLVYDLIVDSTYANPQTDDGFAVDQNSNEFHVVGKDNAKGTGQETFTIPELFTVTISGLEPATTEYTVTIDILSEIRVNGNAESGVHNTQLSKTVSVQEMSSMKSNFYADEGEHKQWSLDSKAWAEITIENNLKAGETSFKTAQKNELVKRGGFSLHLLNGGSYTISTVDANGVSQTTATTLSEEDGYIVINVGQGDETADKFVIEFTGRQVGDIAYSANKQNTVDATDAEVMLAYWVSDKTTEIIIQPGYEVYADINMVNGINTVDATLAYLKGVNKLDPSQEATFLLKLTP